MLPVAGQVALMDPALLSGPQAAIQLMAPLSGFAGMGPRVQWRFQMLHRWSPELKSPALSLTLPYGLVTWITERWKKPNPLKRALFFHSRQWVCVFIDPTQTCHIIPQYIILFILLVGPTWAQRCGSLRVTKVNKRVLIW